MATIGTCSCEARAVVGVTHRRFRNPFFGSIAAYCRETSKVVNDRDFDASYSDGSPMTYESDAARASSRVTSSAPLLVWRAVALSIIA